MSRKNKLLIVLLSVIFCFSVFSLSAFAVGENGDEGGYSDIIPGDNQGGGDENGGNGNVDIPPENGGGDSNNGGYVDNNGENNGGNSGEGNGGNVDENNGENYGENSGGNVDNNYSSGYVDNNGGGYGNEYNYGYSENNGNSEDGGYEQGYYNNESSYLGGGQTYVEPENIAPSASLYNSSGSVSEKTLNSSDWNDISERLKNAGNSADDGDDFGFIQNNNSLSDNGGWMLVASIVCFALSAAGIVYFIVLTLQNNRKGKPAAAAETGRVSRTNAGRDYYGDGYKTNSVKRSNKSSKFDTAEVSLPKNTQGRRYKNSGRRYR